MQLKYFAVRFQRLFSVNIVCYLQLIFKNQPSGSGFCKQLTILTKQFTSCHTPNPNPTQLSHVSVTQGTHAPPVGNTNSEVVFTEVSLHFATPYLCTKWKPSPMRHLMPSNPAEFSGTAGHFHFRTFEKNCPKIIMLIFFHILLICRNIPSSVF